LLSIIPHTLKNTTLESGRIGDFVNLECDVLARYIEKMLNIDEKNTGANDKKLLELLERSGF